MASENEELDIVMNRRWQPFVNLLRGGSQLDHDRVVREFDRSLVGSFKRVFKLLKVKQLIEACIAGDSAEVRRLRIEHRSQRDRAETFVDLIVQNCAPGMNYREAVDEFVHSACARIIDQAVCRVVPSDNFPTIDDYRHASAIWLFRLDAEGRIPKLVDQILRDPTKLRAERRTKEMQAQEDAAQLGMSLIDGSEHEGISDGNSASGDD